MAEDMWAPDPDRHVAATEARLYRALRGYLYGVHQGAHRALGLPAMDRAAVTEAYHVAALPELLVKSSAADTFAELLAQPRQARRARDLAEALTDSWFEQAGLDDEARRAVVVSNLTGQIQAQQLAPEEYTGWREYAAQVVDPDVSRALHYGMERACEHVTALKDTTRAVLAGAVTDALLRGDSPATLASDLVQRFGTLNRDARRLAITEIAYARANGYLNGIPDGGRVEWFSAADACPACERLDGRAFTVRRKAGDPEKTVWPGKNNVGRKAAGRVPAIPFHPNCRCRWTRPKAQAPAGVSERLTAMQDALEKD